MANNFTSKLLRVALVSAFVLGASYGHAANKLYLCDVETEAELNSDVFGVPMGMQKVGDTRYHVRYYNEKANTKVFFLSEKHTFQNAYGMLPNNEEGELFMGTAYVDIEPLVFKVPCKYYDVYVDINDMTFSYRTYEAADFMDPIFWEYGSANLNAWQSFVDTGSDDWQHTDDAWLLNLEFGYSTGPGDVDPFVQHPYNKHLYYWDTPHHYDAGQNLSFIIHNPHPGGWWNYITWRVEDSADSDIFLYYGMVVKQKYLDWWFGQGKADWQKWKNDEGYRKQLNWNGGNDQWASARVGAEGEYTFVFDTHAGRGRMIPGAYTPVDPSTVHADDPTLTDEWVHHASMGINGVKLDDDDAQAPVLYYNMHGMLMHGDNLPAGIYIKRQGNVATKVIVK